MTRNSKTTKVHRAFRAGSVARLIATTVALALATSLIFAGSALAAFGIQPGSFKAEVTDQSGALYTQAGGHPYEASTSFTFNTKTNKAGETVPDGIVKDIVVELPPGFVGNPQAVPECTESQFKGGFYAECPAASQVGQTVIDGAIGTFRETVTAPVYNMQPGPGQTAVFAFSALATEVHVIASARTDGDYGLTTTVPNVSQQLTLFSTKLTFWGVPADHSHDAERGLNCYKSAFFGECVGGGKAAGIAPRPFLTNPANCNSGEPVTTLRVDPTNDPGQFLSYTANSPEPTGCDRVTFTPKISVQPDSTRAGSTAGYNVNLSVPQEESTEALATPELRQAVVTLPAGVVVSPSAANGLAGCSDEQIAVGSNAEPICPDASKIGTVSIDTPLLSEPLQGSIYLGRQTPSQLLRLFLVVRGPGLLIKLPGKVDPDPITGQLTATFDNNPPLPFSELNLNFFGGPQASLTNPATCGTYTTTTELTPWSAPQSGPPATPSSSFVINQGCGNAAGFKPGLQAGTNNPLAGGYSPFQLNVSREDGSQQLSTITAKLPAGLLAKLAGIPYCSDQALAALPSAEGTGAAQLANPSCPAASQVGTVGVTAGAGPNPFYLDTGKAYLAGPYKGAPLSIAFITPALAGPFDLGNVLVRAALRVDQETTQITAVSDPLPTMLHGIPLDLRSVRVNMDREGFTLNPTSCEASAVDSTLTSTGGATATPSSRFQVADCGALPFAPKLSLRVLGKTNRGAKPRLRAVVSAKPGEANIGRAQVNLPHSEFLEQNHIKTVCTRVQWNEGDGNGSACPAGSIYGKAKAWTPLLDKPLEGPVYLRSNGGERKLPDLVAALDGQVNIALWGKVDSGPNHGIRNTFEVVPDAPVSRFVLEMNGGKKGLLVNSEDLCSPQAQRRAVVRFTGQNGKVHAFKPLVQNQCGKAKKSTKKNAGHARTR
jgi:hypothetical protein